ncbi:hypothetical protein ACFOWX_12260 [Sphingorhabdus arenilitoris]|uniref:Uncharacterized protein n=1 Tax=Sphingorhabdus arenilitoris TaxID=1490041 RepID=A0ABV8RKH3_9SPHN
MFINREIEKFLIEQDMPATKFGRLAAHDPRLVLDIRMGRELRSGTIVKLRSFMNRYRQECGI